MLNFILSWWAWLLGAGTISLIVIGVALSIFAPKVLDVIAEFLKPAAGALGRFAAAGIDGVKANVKDGAPYIARNPKAIFCFILGCSIVAVAVYGYTKHTTARKTEAHVVRTLHAHYRFIPKPKPKTVVQNTLDGLRKSLGGVQ